MLPATHRILVLDDEPAILGLVTAVLRQAGFTQISTSSSIAGARQCWQAQVGNFDLVLSDFCLPDGSAIEWIDDLLRHKPHLQVVLMSGFCRDDLALDEEWGRRVDVLQKPFSQAELVRVVEAALKVPAEPLSER